MKPCPPCHGECNQGRACPAKYAPEEDLRDLGLIGGVFIALGIVFLVQQIAMGIWWIVCLPVKLWRRR
jgi:hypothetical protein